MNAVSRRNLLTSTVYLERQRTRGRQHLSTGLVNMAKSICDATGQDSSPQLTNVVSRLHFDPISEACNLFLGVASSMPKIPKRNDVCGMAKEHQVDLSDLLKLAQKLVKEVDHICHGLCLKCFLEKAPHPDTCRKKHPDIQLHARCSLQ